MMVHPVAERPEYDFPRYGIRLRSEFSVFSWQQWMMRAQEESKKGKVVTSP
jgi:hypothetical protein